MQYRSFVAMEAVDRSREALRERLEQLVDVALAGDEGDEYRNGLVDGLRMALRVLEDEKEAPLEVEEEPHY